MRLDVLCVGPVQAEVIYTTKSIDLGGLSQKLKGLMRAQTSLSAQDVSFGYGGSGYVAAATFARLGFKSALASNIGQDSLGCDAVRKLKADGVDVTHTKQTVQTATAIVTTLRSPQDDCFDVRHDVASAGYDKTFIAGLSDTQPDWLCVSGPFVDLRQLKALLGWAHKRGVRTLVQLSRTDILLARRIIKVISAADICVFEYGDAELLTHHPVAGDILRSLRSSGLKSVLLLDGVQSAHAIHDGFLYEAKPRGKAKGVNATGAFDVFGPSFLASLERYGSVEQALDFGLVAAQSVANYVGSEAGLPKSFPHRPGKVSKKFL